MHTGPRKVACFDDFLVTLLPIKLNCRLLDIYIQVRRAKAGSPRYFLRRVEKVDPDALSPISLGYGQVKDRNCIGRDRWKQPFKVSVLGRGVISGAFSGGFPAGKAGGTGVVTAAGG